MAGTKRTCQPQRARSRADANFGKTGQSSRAGPGTHISVGPAASERFDVPQFGACSHRAARQPGRTGERIRAAHAAGGIGRRGQFGDQRRALRSRQSQRGCLNGHPLRIATTTAMDECVITSITKEAMIATLNTEPKFSELFMVYLLQRNSRVEEDLIDQLFNSSE